MPRSAASHAISVNDTGLQHDAMPPITARRLESADCAGDIFQWPDVGLAALDTFFAATWQVWDSDVEEQMVQQYAAAMRRERAAPAEDTDPTAAIVSMEAPLKGVSMRCMLVVCFIVGVLAAYSTKVLVARANRLFPHV